MDNNITKLSALYSNLSKHSNYQVLSSLLSPYLTENSLSVKSRNEEARMVYILRHVDVSGKTAFDIGANTGFFTFELLKNGAQSVQVYEGNPAHADFIELASKVIGVEARVAVHNEYFDFTSTAMGKRVDVGLLLNVLHHIGDDFGNPEISLKNAKRYMIDALNSFADKVSVLVFQLGFCWQGNRNKSLFPNGTKQELIDFVSAGIREFWSIAHIGVPMRTPLGIEYQELDAGNLPRMDELGEFLNRPLFILNSKRL